MKKFVKWFSDKEFREGMEGLINTFLLATVFLFFVFICVMVHNCVTDYDIFIELIKGRLG